MFGFMVRRILWMIPVLLLTSIVTFALMHAVPGSPWIKEDKPLPKALLDSRNLYYHLDEPVYEQYLRYMGNALRGDFGPSYVILDRSVSRIISKTMPVSAVLGLLGLGVSIGIGVPPGIAAALRQNTIFDYATQFLSIALIAVPTLILAPTLVWVFGLKLRIFPVALWGTWRHAVLPAFSMGIGGAAGLARLTRASILQVAREDYIRRARAKGLPERVVTVRHILRNALIPVVTVIGPMVTGVLTGSMIMATTLLYAVLLVVANVFVDIGYSWVDPRIRLGGEKRPSQ